MKIETVSKILYEFWDPLNIKEWVTATDEYDDWSPDIVTLLNKGADRDEIANRLDKLLTDQTLKPDHAQSVVTANELVRVRDSTRRNE